jgi:hypothetical protein
MHNALRRLAVLGMVAGLGLAALAAETLAPANGAEPAVAAPAKSPALSKQRYDLILANLDAGGDLLVVANMEGWIQDAVQSLVKPITLMGGNDPEFKSVIECLGKFPGFLNKNGFYGLQGFGVSMVPRADGLNDMKCFIARDPAVTWTPLWLAMVGGKPRTIACTDFLPADTELAQTGTGECGALWKMIRSGVAELGTPAFVVSFNSQIAVLATNWGVNLDKIFESMAGEAFFSIQFSKTKTMALPGAGAGAPVSMPEPAFLMGTAVKDNALVEALEAAIAKSGMLSVTNRGDGIKIIKLPLPIPFPFQPAYTVHEGFFLFGSTPDVVAAGITAFRGKTGLTSTPEFQKAFKGLPMVNNGLAYMSPRFMNTVMDVQKAMISRDPAQGAKMAGLMDEMMGCKKDMSAAKVFLNTRNGLSVVGISSAGAKEMAASVMIAPVGLMAAIAIPSFMKARSTSQSNACINNLRMLEAAKEQWALENKKAQGDAVLAPGILKYLGTGRMPICPQGGRYTLNVIGRNARCSMPGHQLRE